MNYDAVIFDFFGTSVDNAQVLGFKGAEYNRTLSNGATTLSIAET